MSIELTLKDQINKLALIQYLIWQRELPEGFNWQAIELSFCYQLLGIPFSQKLSQFSLGTMRAMILHLAKKHDLPKYLAGLKLLERSFRLEIEGERFPVSDCAAINRLLSESKSKLRLCSGFYGAHKFYLLGEAAEQQAAGCRVYRLKHETAVTPGCHLLMAAMVDGRHIFLRETSARFLFHQKWQGLKEPENTGDKIKHFTLEQFGGTRDLILAFMDNLFYHELNHGSLGAYVKDTEVLGLAQGSIVLGQNILTHLQEVFADWLPAKESPSPLQKIIEAENSGRLALYVADNWFYDSSFPEQQIFSSLSLAPLFRHNQDKAFNWQALTREIRDLSNGSLLFFYLQTFEKTAERLKQIVKESEFILTDRPINFKTISAYIENDLKNKNKGMNKSDYAVTYWSNIFNYLKKYSKEGYRQTQVYLKEAEIQLKQETAHKLGASNKTLSQIVRLKAQEIFGAYQNA